MLKTLVAGALLATAANARPEVIPVPTLDVLKYAGRWYQGEHAAA
jgi:lipocalin